MSVLVVDDDPEIVAMIGKRLSTRGYDVRTAGAGSQAIELARRARPDVVLLDVMMPGRSGWEVARELKADPTTRDVKIVMVSAIGETNAITAPIYGADAHVDKPFDFAVLESVLESVLAR